MGKVIGILLLLVSTNALADVDYNCLNACTSEGQMYGYCQSKCSYDSAPVMRQVDYNCVNKCTAAGNLYNYCTQRCSF